MARILIVAGHWEVDLGAIGYTNGVRIAEARANLNVALKLQELLQDSGHEIIMYRVSHDDPKDLNGNAIVTDVMNKTRELKADYAVHIHHNAGGGVGAECCVQMKSNVSAKSKDLATAIIKEFNAIGQTTHGTGIVAKWNSTKTASYYGVLRAAEEVGTVAVITEFAYLDSVDIQDIDTLEEQWKEAEAIEAALNKFIPPIVKAPTPTYSSKAKYEYIGTTHVVTVDPLALQAKIVNKRGSSITEPNFINGGYFWADYNASSITPYDERTLYPHGHLVNDGKILYNCPTHGKPVTTLCVFYDGVVQVKPVYDISKELGLKFAISGAGIYPINNIANEGFTGQFSDIARSTTRSYIGYRKKDNKIVICTRPLTDIPRAMATFKSLGVDFGITLDSGGSTCEKVDGQFKISTVRVINNIITW